MEGTEVKLDFDELRLQPNDIGVITFDRKLSAVEVGRLKAQWERLLESQHTGPRMFVLDGGARFQVIRGTGKGITWTRPNA